MASSSPSGKTTHGAMFFLTVKAGCDNHLQKRKILLDKSSQIGIKIER
jgi:hypothetical protein